MANVGMEILGFILSTFVIIEYFNTIRIYANYTVFTVLLECSVKFSYFDGISILGLMKYSILNY